VEGLQQLLGKLEGGGLLLIDEAYQLYMTPRYIHLITTRISRNNSVIPPE
jgi:histidinol-phosphate/aromatic aminotransferase/cobyric acid decarboxylase-like protein